MVLPSFTVNNLMWSTLSTIKESETFELGLFGTLRSTGSDSLSWRCFGGIRIWPDNQDTLP